MERSRLRLDLAGIWRFALDPDDRGRADGWPESGLPASATALAVPGVWNRRHPGYEGVAWYERRFIAPHDLAGPAVALTVGGANQFAEFWLNGEYVGSHEGGYTPFALRVEAALRPGRENRLLARVVDPPLEGEAGGLVLADTACSKETWYYRYGGIWGDVALERAPAARIVDVFARAEPDLGAALVDLELEADPSGVGAGTLAVELLDPDGRPVAQPQRHELPVPVGTSRHRLRLSVGRPRPWEPERPERYRLRVRLEAGGEEDRVALEFGLRFSELVGGRFRLNGRERPLRGALLQPNYPLDLIRPPSPELLDREIAALRAGGFNLVRVHLRPAAPGLLERADRAGLLVYEETPLAWIRPSPRLRDHGVREVTEMLRRDRNHPCVAIWGIFNENRAAAAAVGAELLDLAHQIDPTRPVIDDSGGSAIGEEGGWPGQTMVRSPLAAGREPLNDLHVYFAAPLRRGGPRWRGRGGRPDRRERGAQWGRFRLSVEGDRLVDGQRDWPLAPGAILVSEFGYGGLPDLERVAEQFGDERGTLDAQDVLGYRDSLRAGFAARRLEEVFGDVQGLVLAAQRLQAGGDVDQVDALRRNPRVAGYVVTQLQDAAWELSAGLTDLWRRPKLALAALAEANAPQRLIVRPVRWSARPGESIAIRAWLVSDQPLDRTRGSFRLEAVGGGAVERPVRVAGRIAPLGTVRVRLPETTGPVRLQAELVAGARRLERALELFAVEPAERRGEGLQVLGPRLAARLPGVRRWNGAPGAALVDGGRALAPRRLKAVADWVARGGHAIFLDLRPETARAVSQALGLELTAHGSRGSFLGYFHWHRGGPLFAGLPGPGLADRPYAEVVPAWSLGELAGAQVLAGCVTVGAGRSWAWFADVQTLPFGSGRLTFYQYRPHRAGADDPVGERLLANLARVARLDDWR